MYDVVSIGSATRDVFLSSPLFKALKDEKHLPHLGFPTGEAQCFPLGAKIEIEAPTFTIGGGAANAAVTFGRQGLRSALVAKLGFDDAHGNELASGLLREGVKPLFAFDKKKMTAYSVILTSPSGERTILNYRGASEDLTSLDIPSTKVRAKWAYITPGRIAFPVILNAVRSLHRAGVKIAMDPSKHYLEMGAKKLKPLLETLEVIKMNREEASYLTGISYKDERRIFKRFDELVPGLAIMTDGSKGVLASDGERLYRAGTYKEKRIANRTGAGDAFGSGLVAGFIRKGSKLTPDAIEYALRLGSANATSVVEHIGAQVGILRKGQFEKESRWKKFTLHVETL
jgi:sugar/nucleoside kinase (ribokinase family)